MLFSVCSPGTYGPECRLKCHCQNGASCNRFHGCKCPAGWHGLNCEKSGTSHCVNMHVQKCVCTSVPDFYCISVYMCVSRDVYLLRVCVCAGIDICTCVCWYLYVFSFSSDEFQGVPSSTKWVQFEVLTTHKSRQKLSTVSLCTRDSVKPCRN